MQEGLFLLWSISLAASMIAFAYVEILLTRWGRSSSRRHITGCELARQILDRNGQHGVAVVNESSTNAASRLGSSCDQLFLTEKIYFGTEAVQLARAVHAAGRHFVSSKPFLPAGGVFRTVVILSWCFILAGFIFRWHPIVWLGQILFLLTFLLTIASLPEEWEAIERVTTNLASIEMLGPEERVGIIRLLRVIRWSPLAEPLKVPLRILRGRRANSRKAHVLSKS